MLPQLEQALKERKEVVNPNYNWFVTGEKEQFMRPQQFNRLFSEFVERNSLVDAYGKKIVPHGLRHNFATVGIRAGMDIASLALMMGHASRAMTLDTYHCLCYPGPGFAPLYRDQHQGRVLPPEGAQGIYAPETAHRKHSF